MKSFVDSPTFTDGNLYIQADKLAVLIPSFAVGIFIGICGYQILRTAKHND